MHWWLPKDEGYPPIVRSIRKFVAERSSAPKDLPTEDLRDMKAIFEKLNLADGISTPPATNSIKASSSEIVPDVTSVVEDEKYDFGYHDHQGIWGGNR